MNATWAGRDCKFVWRRASNTGSSEFGSQPFGANSGALDPALDYMVQIFRSDGKLLRTEYVKETSYIYSYERNFEDNAGAPLRTFTVKVWARNAYILSALPAQLQVSNPQSLLPPAAAALVGSFKSIFLQIVPPTDADWAGTLVFLSTSSGFVPSGTEAGAGNCVYSGSDKLIVISALSGTTYYLQYASFDIFDRNNLILSGEISVATGTVANADIAAGTITADRLLVSILSAISADAGEITAGSIRGVNVNASSHTTKGSYLTSAPGAGAATLNVKNTADFSSGGGSGWIIDTTNDRDAFAYTGKTANTLTGCSGVLAHNIGATVIPREAGIIIDGRVHEIRGYGDLGGGAGIEEIFSMGTNNGVAIDPDVGVFGSLTGVTVGVHGKTGSSIAGVMGETNGVGTIAGVAGFNNSSGVGVLAVSSSGTGLDSSSSSGVGAKIAGNTTKGNLSLVSNSAPSSATIDQYAQIGHRLYYSDGTSWLPLTQPYFESSEQTITNAGSLTIAHGLGFTPKFCSLVIVCKTAENGYSIGDRLQHPAHGWVVSTARGVAVVMDATNINVRYASGNVFNVPHFTTGNNVDLTNGNWKTVFRAW